MVFKVMLGALVSLVTWCGLALSDQEGALGVAGSQQKPHGIVSGEILKKPPGTTTTRKSTRSYMELEDVYILHIYSKLSMFSFLLHT